MSARSSIIARLFGRKPSASAARAGCELLEERRLFSWTFYTTGNPEVPGYVMDSNSASDTIVVSKGPGGNLTVSPTGQSSFVISTPPGGLFIYGHGGNDIITLTGLDIFASIYGGGGSDQIATNGGHQHIEGGDGDDFLNGGPGNDTIRGNLGVDRVDYTYYAAGWHAEVYLNANAGYVYDAAGVDQEHDTIETMENAQGGSGNDVFQGKVNVYNTFWGGDGNDYFIINDGTADGVDGQNGTDTALRDPAVDTLVSIEVV